MKNSGQMTSCSPWEIVVIAVWPTNFQTEKMDGLFAQIFQDWKASIFSFHHLFNFFFCHPSFYVGTIRIAISEHLCMQKSSVATTMPCMVVEDYMVFQNHIRLAAFLLFLVFLVVWKNTPENQEEVEQWPIIYGSSDSFERLNTCDSYLHEETRRSPNCKQSISKFGFRCCQLFGKELTNIFGNGI